MEKQIKRKTEEQHFNEYVESLINVNLFRKKEDSNFPSLPKVFVPKRNKIGELMDYNLVEITLLGKGGVQTKKKNRKHTLSVISGYEQRVKNYFKDFDHGAYLDKAFPAEEITEDMLTAEEYDEESGAPSF
jgi:hypothetical protein